MKALVLGFLLTIWPVVAYATDCKTDADCATGERCAMADCPSCPAGADCPACDAKGSCTSNGGTPVAQCAADADCPVGFKCSEVEVPCATPMPCTCACASGGDCGPCQCDTPDVSCTPSTMHYCEYSPKQCASDADCDPGFTCEADEVCSGQGCACSACTPEAVCQPCDCPDVPDEPTCTVSGHYCGPKQVECKTDADCLKGWQCVASPAPLCACPACMCAEGVPDCACEPCDCGGATAGPSYCMPGGWQGAGISTPDKAAPSDNQGRYASPEAATATGADASPDASGDAAVTAETGSTGSTGSSGKSCAAGAVPADGFALLLVGLGMLIRRRR